MVVKIEDEDQAMIMMCYLPLQFEALLTDLIVNKVTTNLDTIIHACYIMSDEKILG